MGDVILWRPRPHGQRKPLRSDDLAYPKPADEDAAQALIDAFALRGLEVEIIPEDDGA